MGSNIKNLRSIRKDGTEKTKIPKNATIISTDVDITVEEIENGFLISKEFRTKYQMPNNSYVDWDYQTKKFYSKTNPIKIEDNSKDKDLASIFDEDDDA